MLALFTSSARSQAAGVCPVIGTGTDLPTSLSRSTEERIFLNFEAPSQCRGNVTSWTYCHYDSSQTSCRAPCQYGAKFIVYRRSSSNDDTYEPVPGSVTTKILFDDDVSGFRCRTEEVDQSFEIQENDVVGACVWDQNQINPLYLVGTSGSEDQNLYQFNRRNYEDCTDMQLSSVDTMHLDFRRRAQHRLHLYVNNIGTYA